MPVVEVHEHIPASAQDVWALIRDIEAYPRLMAPVLAIDVLEESDHSAVTAWEVELKGSILKWIEAEEWDVDRYRVVYHQVEGDLERWEGFWQLREVEADLTEATLLVRFEIGIPSLQDMLDPVAERAIRENARRMLRSLAPREPGGEL